MLHLAVRSYKEHKELQKSWSVIRLWTDTQTVINPEVFVSGSFSLFLSSMHTPCHIFLSPIVSLSTDSCFSSCSPFLAYTQVATQNPQQCIFDYMNLELWHESVCPCGICVCEISCWTADAVAIMVFNGLEPYLRNIQKLKENPLKVSSSQLQQFFTISLQHIFKFSFSNFSPFSQWIIFFFWVWNLVNGDLNTGMQR